MGWQIGYSDEWERFVGYGVPAQCDHPGCNEEIDRGVSYKCSCCGLHFCEEHLYYSEHHKGQRCSQCIQLKEDGGIDDDEFLPHTPKPDSDKWVQWVLTDDSWAEWRKENSVFTVQDFRKLEYQQKVDAGIWQ